MECVYATIHHKLLRSCSCRSRVREAMLAPNQPCNVMTHATHRILSSLTLTTGLLLLAYMIFVEDEPGAVPLALVIAGAAWLFYSLKKH